MRLILFLIGVFNFLTSFSQDVISKKDGSMIKVKVTEIIDDVVKYKKFDNLDGPTYNLEKSEIVQIKYINGSIDKFEDDKIEPPLNIESNDSKKLINDPYFKKRVEAIAKDAGEQILQNCSNVKDNYGTDIYWDGVIENQESGEITIPIRTWWNKKWSTDGNKKWIRGKVILRKSGEKKWIYQSSDGLEFIGSSCAENFRLK
jgi:hypothetical protein